MIRPYRLLLVLFIVTLLSQTTFTIDVARTLSGGYPLAPMALGSPWPSITSLSSPAEAAGLRKGDRVIAIEGRAPRGDGDLAQVVHAKYPGARLTITVERDGKPVDFQAPLEPFHIWWSVALINLIFMPWLSILLGFWVTAVRPRDTHAWLVLGILLGLSQTIRPGVLDPRGWPFDIGLIGVAVRDLASAGWPICMMLFGIYFPQRWIVDRRLPWVKWLLLIPLAGEGIFSAASNVAASFDWNLGHWPDLIPGGIVTAIGMTATGVFFMALASKYPQPALAKDDRRRLKVLYWGSTVAMGPSFLAILGSVATLREQAQEGLGTALHHLEIWNSPATKSRRRST
jgi:phosphoserine phosphatase RsbU/P